MTEKAGVAVLGWNSSAVWFDYNNDRLLDLFVCQFVEYNKTMNCGAEADGTRHYCIPRIFKALSCFSGDFIR